MKLFIIQYILFWIISTPFQRFMYITSIKNMISFITSIKIEHIKTRIFDFCILISIFSTFVKTLIFTCFPILLYVIDTFFNLIPTKLFCNLYLMYVILQITFYNVDMDDILEKHHKFYWEEFFKQYNISTPKTIGKIVNGKLIIYDDDFNPRKQYVIKADIGSCAIDIIVSNVHDFMKNHKHLKYNYIIQDFIRSCNHKKEFYRIVTSNKLLSIYANKTTFTDIGKNDFSVFKRNNSICEKIDCGNKVLKKAIRSLKIAHDTKELRHVPFIAWDIVTDCDNFYILEGNFPFGGIRFSNKKEQIKFYNYIKTFISFYDEFV